MSAPRADFRPDIEGLRGVAILLVVLFHAGVPMLAGGFVGVDVFFVLSGFFITGLLVRELAQSGELPLTDFYGRRALRLMPPLLVVLFATLALVMWLYAPIDRVDIAASARAVALHTSNVEFARGAVNYFHAAENPLLHTWSLAVEEQFYVVWPLLVLLFAYAAERWTTRVRDEELATRGLLLGMALVGALSLAASVWLTRTAQPWAFFGMPTRMWEFALGGALAVAMHDRTVVTNEKRARWLQVAGLLLIGIAVATYDRRTPYPGTAALVPAIGAVALLVGGWDAPGSRINRLLGMSWLRWLGRLSFAWYLWHWPLVGLGAVLDRDIGVNGRLFWSALALVLAWLTWRLVEEPARAGRLSRMPAHWRPAVTLVATVVAALVAHGALVGAERRVAMPDQRAMAAARVDRMPHGCWVRTLEDMKGPCEFGDRTSSTTIVLLGDSHAEHWLGALDRAGRERGWKIVAMVKGGCPVADMRGMLSPRAGWLWRECNRWREAMLQRIVATRPAAVILSSWDHYIPVEGDANDWQVSADAWRRGLRRTYARLAGAGIHAVAVRGTPRTWFDVPGCLSRRAAGLPFAESCDYARATSLSPVAIAAQASAARGLPMRIVDMNDRICPTATCTPVRDGTIVFTDDNHLTASFSRSLSGEFGARVRGALVELGARVP